MALSMKIAVNLSLAVVGLILVRPQEMVPVERREAA